MAVCYVETYILQNACVDAGLLWLASAWRGGRINPFRILAGALFGALWALAAAATGGVLRSVLLQATVSVVMVWVALGRSARTDLLKTAGALWMGAAMLGGAAAMGVPMLTAGVATGVAGMALVRRKRSPPPPRVTLTISQGSVTRTMDAIVDTGNRALDPWSGLPAVFVPEGPFIPEEGRVICIRTAAGARILPCFEPERVTIDGMPMRAVVALTPAGFLESALVPWALCAERTA